MKKLYCKNCKWFEAKFDWCWHSVKERCFFAEKHLGKKGGQLGKIIWDSQEFNKDNNCSYYKRKWWKFWIK